MNGNLSYVSLNPKVIICITAEVADKKHRTFVIRQDVNRSTLTYNTMRPPEISRPVNKNRSAKIGRVQRRSKLLRREILTRFQYKKIIHLSITQMRYQFIP